MQITFGAISEPLAKQLNGRLPRKSIATFQLIADSISTLHVYGILPQGAVDLARKRLFAKICAAVKKEEPTKDTP